LSKSGFVDETFTGINKKKIIGKFIDEIEECGSENFGFAVF
jgi:hypothetical protein